MGARTSRIAGLALTVVLALAPLAGAMCDTLCAPAAPHQAAAPSCHEPPPAGATLEAGGGHACPDSHDAQSPQARLTASRDAVDRLAPVPDRADSVIPPAVPDLLINVPSGPFPSPPARAHQSPILRI
jgi:hypothetical protein